MKRHLMKYAASGAFICLLNMAPAGGAEEPSYLLPEDVSRSVVTGKRLKNPFAAKLRQSQARVKDVVRGSANELEQHLKRVKIGTTMFYGEGSDRNRAIINDGIKRPGDRVFRMPGGEVAVLDEVKRRSVIVSISGGGGEAKRIELRGRPRSGQASS